eukprot:2118159-Pyramimonas_sp.AAC.1
MEKQEAEPEKQTRAWGAGVGEIGAGVRQMKTGVGSWSRRSKSQSRKDQNWRRSRGIGSRVGELMWMPRVPRRGRRP